MRQRYSWRLNENPPVLRPINNYHYVFIIIAIVFIIININDSVYNCQMTLCQISETATLTVGDHHEIQTYMYRLNRMAGKTV